MNLEEYIEEAREIRTDREWAFYIIDLVGEDPKYIEVLHQIPNEIIEIIKVQVATPYTHPDETAPGLVGYGVSYTEEEYTYLQLKTYWGTRYFYEHFYPGKTYPIPELNPIVSKIDKFTHDETTELYLYQEEITFKGIFQRCNLLLVSPEKKTPITIKEREYINNGIKIILNELLEKDISGWNLVLDRSKTIPIKKIKGSEPEDGPD